MFIKILKGEWIVSDIQAHPELLFIYSSDIKGIKYDRERKKKHCDKCKKDRRGRCFACIEKRKCTRCCKCVLPKIDKLHLEGQACIRLERNTRGIPCRMREGNDRKAFFDDKDFEKNKVIIKQEVDNIIARLAHPKNKYHGVVIDEFGVGVNEEDGNIQKYAPETYKYVREQLVRLIRAIQKITI
uniref:DUF7831 domain-containing protein n=1 Tax=viral metagenome TaxID=1070528 RepID=A0A6C0EA88_9ZZZZ